MYFLKDFNNIKRCATSVRSFWRRYRAEISAMCQKTKVFVLGKTLILDLSDGRNKKYIRAVDIFYLIYFLT